MKTLALIGECMIELNGEPFGTMRQTYGGDSLNTATYLARVAPPDAVRVHYLTALGDDPLSRGMKARWQADGIDTCHVLTDPARQPGLYLIQLDAAGERTFLYWRNQSAARYLLQHPGWLQLDAALEHFDAIYLSGISLAILPPADRERLTDRLAACAAQGVQILFDGNYRPALWQSRDETRAAYARLLPHVHLALMTDDDERALWDDADIEATIAAYKRQASKTSSSNAAQKARCTQQATSALRSRAKPSRAWWTPPRPATPSTPVFSPATCKARMRRNAAARATVSPPPSSGTKARLFRRNTAAWKIRGYLQFKKSPSPTGGRVRVGAADNSSAGLEFCRVAVQVIVWKEVYSVQPPPSAL